MLDFLLGSFIKLKMKLQDRNSLEKIWNKAMSFFCPAKAQPKKLDRETETGRVKQKNMEQIIAITSGECLIY